MKNEEYKIKNPPILISGFPFLVGEAGLEPARPKWTLEPESSESTNSTTRPFSEKQCISATA